MGKTDSNFCRNKVVLGLLPIIKTHIKKVANHRPTSKNLCSVAQTIYMDTFADSAMLLGHEPL